MIKINKVNNSLTVEGVDNVFYPNNGDNSYPLNSLIVVTDNSDMATFRSVATNDVLFSGLINNITINGEAVTKDNIINKFDAVSNSSTGGGGGSVDAYTKTESDAKYATKDELTAVETIANDADTKADAATSRVEGVETALNNKQDTLVSGTNIKTINNQSILGEGNIEISGGDVDLTNYYTKTETDTKLDTKQNTLVSGTNIKTINGESVLGEGNIEVSGGIKTYEASEVPSVLLEQFQRAVTGVKNQQDYDKYTTTDVTPFSQFLNNLSNGDYLKLYDHNANKLQFIGSRKTGNDFYYYFNIILSGPGETNIFSNYITVTLLSSEIYVGNNKSVKVAKITDIPNTDNFATKNELTAVETSLGNKQDTLVSGTNIKTVNSQSILGEGNIEVTIPDATTATSGAMSAADKTKLDSISNEWTGTQSEYDALTTKDDNIIYYVTE